MRRDSNQRRGDYSFKGNTVRRSDMTRLLLDQRWPRDHSAEDTWCRPKYRMAADLEGFTEAVSMADLLPAGKYQSYCLSKLCAGTP